MNTDNYDFLKSMEPQGSDQYSPYLDKQTNSYINDTNGGIYQNGQSLVTFDMSSIYNSSKWVNTDDMFLSIPLVNVFAVGTWSAGTYTAAAPPTAGWALQTLKSGYANLIHQADIQVDGKTIAETQPFVNAMVNVKLLSELSQNDLKSIGSTLGYSDVLDSTNSIIYNVAAYGNGLTNNQAFGMPISSALATSTTVGYQNQGCCNEAIAKRIAKTVATSTAGKTQQNIIDTLITRTAVNAEFKPTYQEVVGSDGKTYGVYYDLAIIRLKDLFDCMNNIGLVRRFNGTLRLYMNTGALYVGCTANSVTPSYTFSYLNSSFSSTCPFTINNLGVASNGGGLVAGINQITAGLFIGKALTTSYNTVNLANSGAAHNMAACRLYYSSIILHPSKAIEYTKSNTSKRVVYRNYYFNQLASIGAGSSYSQLVQSGVTNPYALIVIPFISSTVNGGFSQWQSPFDTAPSTSSPCILSNLQVSVGGNQVLNSPYYYGFEDYLTQFTNAEALTSSDFGVSCGVVSKEWWEMNRMYYINLSRGAAADKSVPRNIVLSFKNDSLVAIECMVFTIYLDEFKINVESGAISR